MKAIIPFVFLLSAVAAQTTANSGASCAADYIVETCLGTENAVLAQCGNTDYICQCNAYGAIVTCFNNCPNDSRVDSYKGQQKIFCQYASQFPSSTSTASEPTPTGSVAVQTTAAASPTSTIVGTIGTSSGSAASATKTNSAADLVLNAGGVLAAVAGVVVAVL